MLNKKSKMNRLLLVSGSGRNSGKTTLACEIIKNVSKKTAVYALKISPHFHQLSEKQELLINQKGFKVFREKDKASNKDSSRMLQAGAKDVFYIQCEDKDVAESFQKALQFIPQNYPVVCESGSLAKYYKPGLHLLIVNVSIEENKKSFLESKQLADHIIYFDGTSFSLNINQISFNEEIWRFERSVKGFYI